MADIVEQSAVPLLYIKEVKQHLNVDFEDDNLLIESYIAAAEKAVLEYCNIERVPEGALPVFKVAALLSVGDFYLNRDVAGEGIPHSARRLINPYRRLRV